ncbi:MAG: homocysteine S-methyltransferase family protein [Halioglobus sp.]
MNRNQIIINKLAQRPYLTDGGLETALIFLQGIDLPHFASFPLLQSESGREALEAYFLGFVDIANRAGCGFVFESPTWRAHAVWGDIMGYDADALDSINQQAIEFLSSLRAKCGGAAAAHLVSGCVGPKGDGYVVDHAMSAQQARDYHLSQVTSFAAAGADMTSALTLNYPEEAIGIVMACADVELPVVISFTTETNGCLPDGTSLKDAIACVDAATDSAPVYYMINCAHPDHFSQALMAGEPWLQRLGGLRVNASRLSHEELDNVEALEDGDPAELGQLVLALQQRMPHIRVLGGCCGTDHRHVSHMCMAH